MNAPVTLKPKTCKACKQKFIPARPLQMVCGYQCSIAYADAMALRKEKAERKVHREAKQRIKTRSQWMKEAQIEFNRFIRLRDAGKPCICCGNPLGEIGTVGGGYDCGHYRSVGSAPHLRFDERNAHGQRKQCNRYGAGRAVDYRIGLIRRIGVLQVEALEADQSVKKYTIDELKAIKEKYKLKCKELLKQHEALA